MIFVGVILFSIEYIWGKIDTIKRFGTKINNEVIRLGQIWGFPNISRNCPSGANDIVFLCDK